MARLGPFRPARAALVAAPFLLAALPLVFTRPGDPLGTVTAGPLVLTISGDGLRQFATIALKSWISVQVVFVLTLTTPFPELVDGLRALRLPAVFVAIVGFMYRYLQVLGDEGARMNRARLARSAVAPNRRSGGSLGWRARVVGGMVGSLFVRAYERSERVHAAMLSRGFTGELHYIPVPALAPRQLLGLAAAFAALIGFELVAHVWLPRL